MHKYQILDVIDQGAYGIVWKALNKQNNSLVAIKQFKEGDEDEISKNSIQRQIKMLKMLKGQFVVEIKQAFKKKGKIFLIFQYFDKNILNLIQKYSTGLEPKLIQNLIYKTLKCLKFLHQKNILHRDIKPQNILTDEQCTVLKLCDFGFARFLANKQQLTQYVATRWYRSPQLLVGQGYGKPADIWAVGCILGELIDGQPMFAGQNQMDQIFLIKKTLGNLTPRQIEFLTKNPKFMGMQFPPLRKGQSIETKYLGKIQKNALNFLKLCLKVNPNQRITVQQALNHSYFGDLNNDEDNLNDQLNLLEPIRKLQHGNNKSEAKINKIKISDEQDYKPSQSKYFTNKSSLKMAGMSSLPQHLASTINQDKQLQMKKNSNYDIHQNQHMQQTKKKFSNEISPKLKMKKDTNKRLMKIMSQDKQLNVNLDVNLKINVKINNNSKSSNKNYLPEIKQIASKSTKYHQFNTKNSSEKYLHPVYHYKNNNNLSILGQSKQLVKLKNNNKK